MEVTKHGSMLRHCTCLRCGCEFNFLIKDIKKETVENPFDLNMYSYEETIHCPECDKILVLKRSYHE